MKVIAITGTPGTGKSTLAKKIAKERGYYHLNLHSHYKQLSVRYDRKSQSYVIDEKKFLELVKKEIKVHAKEKGIIIDTHISHYLPKKLVNQGIVMTCSNLKELEKRLKKRKYSEAKIRENLDCEIFQVCLGEALERGHKVKIIDSCKK
ncbi:MAG: AAA family ATPase [Candidatus Woesearchaeota archaeon]|jgi:adenylate kinase